MKFTPTPLEGACVVELEAHRDERGSFARAWCAREFAAHGLEAGIAQVNFSSNVRKGTLRGMHFQIAPAEEAKVVCCTRGALFDVIVDLRPNSRTFAQWFGARLDAERKQMLFVPKGFAHGFQTLEDDTEVLYLISGFHDPAAARGIRYDDPSLAIEWPLPVSVVSERDRAFGTIESLGRL